MPTSLAVRHRRYRLDQLLGEGAQAQVWRAWDRDAERAVAIKILPRADEALEARLGFELAALGEQSHPSLPAALDLQREEGAEGRLFLVMELVDGSPAPIAFAGLAPAERARRLVALIGDVASGLAALHERGVIHHDVKPDNLLVDAAGRARLIDLGLGGRGEHAGRGTLAFMAPESLLGVGDARIDLYALGATAFALWCGHPPWQLADAAALARALLAEEEAPPLPSLRGVRPPTGLAHLVARLLRRDPDRRPASARAVVEEAARVAAGSDGEVLPPEWLAPIARPPLVGREGALAELIEPLERALGRGPDAPTVVAVAGPTGSGRSRLLDEALRAVRLRQLARGLPLPRLRGRDLAAAGAPASSAGDEERRRAARVGAVADSLAATGDWILLDDPADPLARGLIAAAIAGAAAPGLVLLECSVEAAPSVGAVARVEIAPLAERETVALVRSLREDLSTALGRAVHRASGGLPGFAVELARAAAALRRAPPASAVAELAESGLSALVARRAASLPPRSRAALEALAILGAPSEPTAIAALAQIDRAALPSALAAARDLGLVTAGADGFALPTEAHWRAVESAIPARRARALHERALAIAPSGERGVEARARHLAAIGPRAAAATALVEAAEAARARLQLPKAIEHLRAAVARGASPIALGELLVEVGDYPAALRALDGDRSARGALAAGRALQRSGDARARRLLERALARHPGAKEEPALRGLLARVRSAAGDHVAALELCGGRRPIGTAALPLLEGAGLARLFLGDLDGADAEIAEAERRSSSSGEAILLARARSLRGMVAQARGDLDGAAEAYRAALAAAGEANDLHGAAIYAHNLGGVLRERADYAGALAATESAARDLARLGKAAERAGALFNLGNLLLSVGDLDGAERARAQAESLARGVGAARPLQGTRALAGDLARRRGELTSALRCYREAEELAVAAEDPHAAAWARLARAQTLVEAGRAIEAEPLLASVTVATADPALSAARATARLAAALSDEKCLPAHALVEEAEASAAQARGAGRRDGALRAEVTLARAYVRLGDAAQARTAVERARTQFEEIRMATPESYRDRLDEDPDARRLRALIGATSPTGSVDGGRPAEAARETRLRRLVAVNKRLAAELRLDPLLELVIDAVIDLTGAERGFVLLADATGQLAVTVARNIDRGAIDAPGPGEHALSRSIAERAARDRSPVVTIDAAGDERFESARSVAGLRLRSVLAAPLIARGRVVGCLYVDHRLRAGAFGDDDVALVLEFADQAAIAVENARLLAENERRGVEVAALAQRLEEEVASQRVELGSLHAELRRSREALSVRYDYRNLVGRAPRMLELLRLLDRVTDTALPVVIHGESGTGKELVARAIHHNGPRAGKPFVSENCAAIPETLLEAALFGHARGAFTGADAERRGLFEIADGGTLFLDEVGEMSPAMQSKLLRVLQEGEFRRVGGERGRKVDVRVVCASNRDLGELVEAGRFRQDLFYRLNVVKVVIPPLRERSEDIPLLVEHFLGKHAAPGKPPKRVARAALTRLMAHRWPGNVRELENEILRAGALGGETLTVEDLSPAIASSDGGGPAPDDLTLKGRVERLERGLLREALARSRGNQSQAARLLGLSRFGLQKKLKRYRLERT